MAGRLRTILRSGDIAARLGGDEFAILLDDDPGLARAEAVADRIIDALCEPPESFVLASVIAHVLTFSAHRRQLVRQMLRMAGHEVDHGDPIEWLRAQQGVA